MKEDIDNGTGGSSKEEVMVVLKYFYNKRTEFAQNSGGSDTKSSFKLLDGEKTRPQGNMSNRTMKHPQNIAQFYVLFIQIMFK